MHAKHCRYLLFLREILKLNFPDYPQPPDYRPIRDLRMHIINSPSEWGRRSHLYADRDKLVHLQGRDSYTRRKDGRASWGELGCAWLAAELGWDSRAGIGSKGFSNKNDPEHLSNLMNPAGSSSNRSIFLFIFLLADRLLCCKSPETVLLQSSSKHYCVHLSDKFL